MSPDAFDDDIDQALKSGLSALAPEVDGGDDTLAALRPRFRRARTRNRVTKIGGAVIASVAITSIAALAAPSSGRTHVQVSSPPTTAPDQTSKPPRSSTTSSTTTSVPAVSGPTPTSVSPVPNGSSPSGSSPTTPITVPQSTPGTAGRGDDKGNSGRGRGGPGSGTTKPAQNGVKTYQSPGGSITVRFSRGRLSLDSVSPANGYDASKRRNDPYDIDVRFENEHGEWRIRVRVENGRPTSSVGHT